MSSLVKVKNPNGTIYVYENISYWDKKEKKTKHKRKVVGKIMPGSSEVVPTHKKNVSNQQSQTEMRNYSVLIIGPSLLLDKAASETGLTRILSSVFSSNWRKILTCAYFLASQTEALSHIEQWSKGCIHPNGMGKMFADQRVSELLASLTPSLQHDFFQKWAQHADQGECFALDITSVSSYSEYINFVRWGYNRDHEKLPQINLLMLTSEKSHLPIYYRVLNGSINDVSTLQESLECLDFLNCSGLHLVMDKGFFSEPNVNAMYDKHYKFTLGVSFVSGMAKRAVERNRESIEDHHHFICVDGDSLFAATELTKWNGHRCYIHTFYDCDKAAHEKKEFDHDLLDCFNELSAGVYVASHKNLYEKYFIIKETPKRGIKVSYNEDAISKHNKNTIGWFVLISNKIKDAAEALYIYRQKDAVEKCFDDLKNELDMNRLRVHKDATMAGRLFVQFISLILTTYLKNILRENGWLDNHNLPEIINEMKTLTSMSFEGSKKRIISTPSKMQQDILDLFGICV